MDANYWGAHFASFQGDIFKNKPQSGFIIWFTLHFKFSKATPQQLLIATPEVAPQGALVGAGQIDQRSMFSRSNTSSVDHLGVSEHGVYVGIYHISSTVNGQQIIGDMVTIKKNSRPIYSLPPPISTKNGLEH